MQDTFRLDPLVLEAQARALRAAHARHLVQGLIARLRGTPLPAPAATV